MQNTQKNKTVEDYLEEVDYKYLNSTKYHPTDFAMHFLNTIKLINGSVGESNKSPPMHTKMLDTITNRKKDYLVNLCFRGSAKTTLFAEYFFLYLAMFNELPNLKDISGAIYVGDSIENGVKTLRKNIEFRYNNSDFLKEYIPEVKFTDTYIEFLNKSGKRLGLKLFGATTGLRGTKIFGKRPSVACLDDLISDEASKSKVVMNLIKDTVYKGINHALDPTKRLVIFSGTPFNKEDIIVEAVESGAWEVNVYPVCEKFPCSIEEFRGAWEDRFTYDYIDSQYKLALGTGHVNAFYQELMLQITSEDARLVQDKDIKWYNLRDLVENKDSFNYYITTDFATSSKNSADYSVISVWAYSNNGDWFYVDGVCARQDMSKNIDDLFRLVAKHKPLSVGIEASGQQGGFITLIEREMHSKKVFFNIASSSKNGSAGIRPTADKLSRFHTVLPWFKQGKMYFPTEYKELPTMQEFQTEIRLATYQGLKGHDDFIDTISQLTYLNAIEPSNEVVFKKDKLNDIWELPRNNDGTSNLDSYLV